MSDPVNAPFDRGEAERAAKALFGNQALHRAAAAMAGCHPRALDYILQAPVIVLSANAGKTGAAAAHSARSFAGPPMRMLCERGAKLRDVMAFYGCGFHLRRLAPNVLHPVRWQTVYHLGRLPPSTLSQILPEARKDQDVWLRALTGWADHCERRCGNRWFRFDWAAVALRAVRRGEEDLADVVADLAIEAGRSEPRAGAVFDLRWTFAQAHAAAERWHAALGRHIAEQKVAQGLGVGFTDAVDYVPFRNEPVTVDGFEFVPLRSCEDLYLEGAAMRHCVASYSREVMAGTARIFSVRQDGRRVATMELDRPNEVIREPVGSIEGVPHYRFTGTSTPSKTWRVVQLKGPCNARPMAGVEAACRRFAIDEQARAHAPLAAASLRDAFPGVTGSFSGEAA